MPWCLNTCGWVLANPSGFRNILAITFTNKATAEMKSRIIEALVSISSGDSSALKETLEKDLQCDDLINRASRALDLILHDYSSFSVTTIDSFFQKIIRSLAREIRLPINVQLQLNEQDVLEEVSARLFDDIGTDDQLREWVTELVEQKMMQDGRWDIQGDILSVAKELSKQGHAERTFDKSKIREFHSKLMSIRKAFETTIQKTGTLAAEAMSSAGVSPEDFSYKTKGPAGYLVKIAATQKSPDGYIPNTYVMKGVNDASAWVTKSSGMKHLLIPLVEKSLLPLLRSAVEETEKNLVHYKSAWIVTKKIYLLGILNDLSRKLAQYRAENNMMLLSDTLRVLGKFISASDTSFVYEKTGNQYRHFLIDEFQDTSGIQWKNLLPLIQNALGSGHMALVVGDAKQSIYRWRGGDIRLLEAR
jgi:ATP-dependent exoDNAse (exonuclease V) beta subunit